MDIIKRISNSTSHTKRKPASAKISSRAADKNFNGNKFAMNFKNPNNNRYKAQIVNTCLNYIVLVPDKREYLVFVKMVPKKSCQDWWNFISVTYCTSLNCFMHYLCFFCSFSLCSNVNCKLSHLTFSFLFLIHCQYTFVDSSVIIDKIHVTI